MEREKGLFIDGGILQGVAVLSLIFFIVLLIPFAGPVVIIMTPLPVLYYCYRFGRMRGLAVLAVSFLIVSGILSLLGHRPNIPVFLMTGFTGVMLSEVLKRCYSLSVSSISGSTFGKGSQE